MHYSKALTVTAGTSASNPVTLTFKVVPQIVTRIRIYFPAGCAGLVRAALFQAEHQFAPSDTLDWFRGDDGAIDYEEYFDMRKGPNKITVKAWNTDDTYDHEILVDLTILSYAIASPFLTIKTLVDALKTMMGL